MQSITSEEQLTAIDRLCQEIYTSDKIVTKEPTGIPFGAKVHLQSFLEVAGFKKMQILYQDKWLSRISVNSSLNALSWGLGKSAVKNIETLPTQELIFICNLLLESSIENKTEDLLELLLLKIVSIDETYSTLCKVLQKADTGYIHLKPSTVYKIFKYHSKIADSACETVSKKSRQELHNSWIVKVCSVSPDLYDVMSSTLMKKYPTRLPEFVDSVCRYGTNELYPCYEQPCVVLCQTAPFILQQPLRDVHNFKLLDELLQLWITHRQSALKLVYHFPYLTECLVEYCDKQTSAQRLCIHLMSGSQPISYE